MSEPAVVEKVRTLLKQRAQEFENGGPHTATFLIFNTSSHCFLRIGDRWAIITHRSPVAARTGDPKWDEHMCKLSNDSVTFNAIGVTSDEKRYPGGFVHGNCQRLAEALVGLGFLSQAECDEFKSWSVKESARQQLVWAQERVRELESSK